MKPPIRRTLKLEVETLKTLSAAALANVGGAGDDPVAKSRLSWAHCPKP
jgi:hypothetical protein